MAEGNGVLEQKRKLQRIGTDLTDLISDFQKENREWHRSMEDNIRLLSQQMESMLRSFNSWTNSTAVNGMNSPPPKSPAAGSGNLGHGGIAGQQSSSVSENRTLQSMFELGKINFLLFDGTDSTEGVRAWLFHSNMIFEIQKIEDNHKSQIAGMHMRGQALCWLMAYMNEKLVWPSWNQFCEDVIARFDLDSIVMPIVQWRNLNQEGTVMEYQRDFERIRCKIDCSEEFAVEMFIAGLKEELRYAVICAKPTTSSQALRVARVQETHFEAVSRRIQMENGFVN